MKINKLIDNRCLDCGGTCFFRTKSVIGHSKKHKTSTCRDCYTVKVLDDCIGCGKNEEHKYEKIKKIYDKYKSKGGTKTLKEIYDTSVTMAIENRAYFDEQRRSWEK